MRVHELAVEDPRPEIWLDHEMWCYNRALRAEPTNTAAVYNRANLVSQGVAWRYRDRVWPSLREMEPQEKIYGVWLEGMAFAPTPTDQLRRARKHTQLAPSRDRIQPYAIRSHAESIMWLSVGSTQRWLRRNSLQRR